MDDLLAKLRAAKPETRDQRDRRRRARLKDRHAVRVASGQKMQDMASLVQGSDTIEASLLSPMSEVSFEGMNSEDGDAAAENLNDEDVADRAATMLEGLRGEGDDEQGEEEKVPLPREDSIRIRRRRESAQDERAARRRRRQQAQSASEASLGQLAIAEEAENEDDGEGEGNEKRQSSGSGSAEGDERLYVEDGDEGEKTTPRMPVTIVHPPSPEQERCLPTPPGEEE